VLLPTIVVGELEAGFLLGSRYRENSQALEEFLSEPFVDIVTVSKQVARQYGRLFSGLRRAGTPLPVNDIWIAACTFSADAHLLTLDADFSRVPGLQHTVLKP
jgi:tRNA(fMet)-specific endonuclease VapC